MCQEVKNLIAKARLEEALNKLVNIVPAHLNNVAVGLQSSFKSLKRDEMINVIDRSAAGQERARITHAALQLCDQLNDPAPDPEPADALQKILFLAANPTDQSRIQTDTEHRILKTQLNLGRHREQFHFLQPQFAVTISELMRAMNDKPTIVHFSGHGMTDGIIITNSQNESQSIPTPALRRLFKPLKDVTNIVVLNACYSADQAKAISEFGMYVVGNNIPIADAAAISFSKGFYNGLGEGKSFEDAFNDAMIVVETEHPNAAGIIEVWKDGQQLDL